MDHLTPEAETFINQLRTTNLAGALSIAEPMAKALEESGYDQPDILSCLRAPDNTPDGREATVAVALIGQYVARLKPHWRTAHFSAIQTAAAWTRGHFRQFTTPEIVQAHIGFMELRQSQALQEFPDYVRNASFGETTDSELHVDDTYHRYLFFAEKINNPNANPTLAILMAACRAWTPVRDKRMMFPVEMHLAAMHGYTPVGQDGNDGNLLIPSNCTSELVWDSKTGWKNHNRAGADHIFGPILDYLFNNITTVWAHAMQMGMSPDDTEANEKP